MNPIDLVVTVCVVLSPATCEEQHLVFDFGGSPAQCSWRRRPISRNGSASIRNGGRCAGVANIRTHVTRREARLLLRAVLQILVRDREHRIGLDLDVADDALP